MTARCGRKRFTISSPHSTISESRVLRWLGRARFRCCIPTCSTQPIRRIGCRGCAAEIQPQLERQPGGSGDVTGSLAIAPPHEKSIDQGLTSVYEENDAPLVLWAPRAGAMEDAGVKIDLRGAG